MENIKTDTYKATDSFDLTKVSTHEDFGKSDKDLKQELRRTRKELGDFQDMLYAHNKYSVLICLQGMDTSGKDSLIREVFKDFNVSGVEVHSFKVPTELELDHNYLWRHYLVLPGKGKFGVFNRTHYENVLVTRVHPEYILGERIPGIHSVEDIDQKFWDRRFEQINNFERHLFQNGTIIFKFFLNLSKEEQRKRLLRRLALKRKHWKFSPGDLKERKLWDKYQFCYQEAIKNTSKEHAPWFVIPADNKKAARLILATILLQSLKKYKDIKEPSLDDKIMANLEAYENELQIEKEN
jgi:PPK2 family polyphosphate:nucleotide phosphotransferase